MQYCLGSKFADIEYKFADKPLKNLRFKAPVTIDIKGYAYPQEMVVPAPGWGQFSEAPDWRGSESYAMTTGNFALEKNFTNTRNWDDYIAWVYKVDHLNVDSFMIFRWIGGASSFILDPLYSSSGYRTEFVNPTQVWAGDGVNVFMRENSIKQLALQIYFRQAIHWAIKVYDGLNRVYIDYGLGKPTYQVRCNGNCPPNTLNCNGCCADCASLNAIARRINVRMQ
jgi:hypothetical protein